MLWDRELKRAQLLFEYALVAVAVSVAEGMESRRMVEMRQVSQLVAHYIAAQMLRQEYEAWAEHYIATAGARSELGTRLLNVPCLGVAFELFSNPCCKWKHKTTRGVRGATHQLSVNCLLHTGSVNDRHARCRHFYIIIYVFAP